MEYIVKKTSEVSFRVKTMREVGYNDGEILVNEVQKCQKMLFLWVYLPNYLLNWKPWQKKNASSLWKWFHVL